MWFLKVPTLSDSLLFPFVTSGGSMWRDVARHSGLNIQPWIPHRVRQQPGLHMVNPGWTRGHHRPCFQWFLVRGQIWLPRNQRDRRTKHMVRQISHIEIERQIKQINKGSPPPPLTLKKKYINKQKVWKSWVGLRLTERESFWRKII